MNDIDLKQVYEIRDIILKYLNGTIDEKEEMQLNQWLCEKESNDELFREIIDQETMHLFTARFDQLEKRKAVVFQHICSRIDRRRPRLFWLPGRGKLWYMAAAVSILFISIATFFYINRNKTADFSSKDHNSTITPGRNTATLTLADGSVIMLDSTGNGILTQQGNTRIIKLDSGQLVYETGQKSGHREAFSNIISTPRGGQYQLQLPDGSKVWLNAASSLRFPTAFDDKVRRVELKGEAYFEIAPVITKEGIKSRFIVDIHPHPSSGVMGTSQVEVLGTHFNIMAYDDEHDMKATLLEGAVKVTRGTATQLLAPGQQAQISKNGPIKLVEKADVNEAVAWKNGYFQFTNANLPAVMRQIARWYDVDISYEGKIPERQFGGKISRNANLSEILKILELSDVHFSVEDKRIIVSP